MENSILPDHPSTTEFKFNQKRVISQLKWKS